MKTCRSLSVHIYQLSTLFISLIFDVHMQESFQFFFVIYFAMSRIFAGGTLDELAEGVLVIGVGAATKQLSSILCGNKVRFTVIHGMRTLSFVCFITMFCLSSVCASLCLVFVLSDHIFACLVLFIFYHYVGLSSYHSVWYDQWQFRSRNTYYTLKSNFSSSIWCSRSRGVATTAICWIKKSNTTCVSVHLGWPIHSSYYR